MSYPTYDTGISYLIDRIRACRPAATVGSSGGLTLAEYLDGTAKYGQATGGYYVNYDGFTVPRSAESGVGRPILAYTIYYHGRSGNAEENMLNIMTSIREMQRVCLTHYGDHVYTVIVPGGRHLLLDRGYDTYQLDVEMRS